MLEIAHLTKKLLGKRGVEFVAEQSADQGLASGGRLINEKIHEFDKIGMHEDGKAGVALVEGFHEVGRREDVGEGRRMEEKLGKAMEGGEH
jgi:hypothetical protein